MITFTTLAQILWTSLATSSYFVLFAVAFALVLKVNNVFNFAQAAAMTIAFYAAHASVEFARLPGVAAFLVALVATLAASFGLERLGFEALRRKQASVMFVFIFTLIVSEFVSYVAMLIFGTWPKTIFPQIFWPVTLVSGVAVSAWDVPAILGAVALVVGLFLFMRFTRWGQFMVGVADNPTLAELYGINRRRVFMLTMLIAGLFVTVGMFLYGTRAQVHPATSLELMLFAVAATIIGGIGNIWGAAFAAVVLGVIQNMSILIIPSEWQGFLLYAFLFLAIIFFPQGLRLPERRIRTASPGRHKPMAEAAGSNRPSRS